MSQFEAHLGARAEATGNGGRSAADAGALGLGLIAALPCFVLLSGLLWSLS